MADWQSLQAEFLAAHQHSGIGAKAWCEQQGLIYSTARRYIKLPKDKSPKDKAQKPVKTGRGGNQLRTKSLGNSNAVKHGGYRRYFKDQGIIDEAEQTSLEDELFLCRARIHLVIQTIEAIQAQLDKHPPVEVSASLFESLFKADQALDKNIARVESIVKTLSSIELDRLNRHKIVADTRRSVEMSKLAIVGARKGKVQTELAQLQVAKAQKDAGGTSKLDEYIDRLTAGGVDKVVG